MSISGLTRGTEDQNIVAIAATSGLRLFENGNASSTLRSPSFKQDWMRINWAAAATIEVIDDLDEQTYLACSRRSTEHLRPTSSSLSATRTAKTRRRSITRSMMYRGATASLSVGKSNSTAREEVWLGPTSSGTVWRREQDADSRFQNRLRDHQSDLGEPVSDSLTGTGRRVLIPRRALHRAGNRRNSRW